MEMYFNYRKICTLLLLVSDVACEIDDYYYGSDSGEGGYDYQETLYDSKDWPLNLEGSLRQRMALNGAIAEPGQSFVCSPLSALMPLGKLALGATGTCQRELHEAVGVSSKTELKNGFKFLLAELRTLSGVKLTVCSRIYVSKTEKLATEFADDAKDVFKSSVKRINLEKPDKVARKINKWVREKTNNMIDEIITPNSISPSTSVILVNAVYFSGTWQKKFNDARMEDFFTPTEIRKVPMMTREGKYKYTKNDALDCQIAEIPYVGGQASFVIFLPNTKDGLPLLLYKLKLAPDLMQTAMTKMRMEQLILSIPKFKTETEIDLRVSYEKLGLTQILRTEDSGMNKIVQGGKHLYVSKAIQKAVIEVNENGTRASAASAVVAGKKATLNINLEPIIFNANRPFLYIVKMKRDIVFAGVMEK